MVSGDRNQLSRLIDQLVNNALTYGRAGEVPWARLEVETCQEQGAARLCIEDRGRGLLAGAEAHIFERFSRLDDQEHPAVPGTGLGLYIARELAARHHGRLEVEWTEPGQGSLFALYLPLRRNVDQQASP
jgi:signal transduction histidine kinase